MHINSSRPRQRGVATVFVTVVLLLAVALVVLYASRSALVEQRLSANEVRAKQALAAAQAGIDAALAHMNNGGVYQNDVLDDGNYVLDDPTPVAFDLINGVGTSSYYRVVFSDPNPVVALPNCPPTRTGAFVGAVASPTNRLTTVAAVSCGWSDDDSSVQRVVQLFEPGPALAGTVSTPLVTAGATNVATGTTTVFNYFNDLTVWSGEGLEVGKSGGPGTCNAYIRDVSVAGGHQLPMSGFDFRGVADSGSSKKDGHVCTTSGSTVGHDSVAYDTTLSTKTEAQFFEYFMGATKTEYRDAASWVGAMSGLAAAVLDGHQVLWVDVPAGTTVDLPKVNIGTTEKPVVLVIDGDLELKGAGGNEVNGFVFVTGEVIGAGNWTFYGSLVVAKDYKSNGTVNIVYDPNVLTGVSKLGKATKLNGSWRDW